MPGGWGIGVEAPAQLPPQHREELYTPAASCTVYPYRARLSLHPNSQHRRWLRQGLLGLGLQARPL